MFQKVIVYDQGTAH